jgi:hypothetical protein
MVMTDPNRQIGPWRSCGSGACVEVTKVDESYLVRDSKDPDGPTLAFTSVEWEAFVHGVQAGAFQFD